MPDIHLARFTMEHAARTLAWMRVEALRDAFMMRSRPTVEGNKRYWEKVLDDRSQMPFAIMLEGSHVGNCGLKNIDDSRASAELWIYIGDPAVMGKGIGGAATGLLTEKAFKAKGLNSLYLYVNRLNEAAIKMYERAGFTNAARDGIEECWGDRAEQVRKMELVRK